MKSKEIQYLLDISPYRLEIALECLIQVLLEKPWKTELIVELLDLDIPRRVIISTLAALADHGVELQDEILDKILILVSESKDNEIQFFAAYTLGIGSPLIAQSLLYAQSLPAGAKKGIIRATGTSAQLRTNLV